ncbi:hypothetical protein I4U23_020660 [Adineta vaga]|nr:hypothetical protein I4U23_020660 [Adineta vaga]
MSQLTNGNTTNKINRIQNDEKELLFQLRKIYASDYKKYSEHIRHEPDIPLSIRKIYKLLDDRKAYRRISDYFHRIRRSNKAQSSRTHDHDKTYRISTRRISSEPESVSTMQIVNDMDDDDDDDQNLHQQSDNSTTLNDSDERFETNRMGEDDLQPVQPSSSISPKHQQYQQSSISSTPSLLIVRESLHKALRELDRAIVSKTDNMMEDYDHRQEQQQQRSSINKIDLLTTGHSNLDDMVRSLSNVVTEQEANARLIIEESSALLLDENAQIEKQSIRHVIERLNGLVDRGHSIYDRIESILSEF